MSKDEIILVKIKGKSMFPMLKDDSLAMVSLCSLQDLHTGDIAIFKGGDVFICHRFFGKVSLNGSSFLKTKSDIAYNFDPLTKNDKLIGKVVSFQRGIFTVKVNNVISRIIGLFLGYLLPLPVSVCLRLKSFINKCFIK